MGAHTVDSGPAGSRDFEFLARGKGGSQWLSRASAYAIGLAYVRGQVEVHGDLVAAVRFQIARTEKQWKQRAMDAICRFTPWTLTQRWANRDAAARNIRFHYDRSNDFYRQFLDPQMVYSCAYFDTPQASLDHAQAAKLDLVCRKLRIQPGDRFLDIGCGWGALVVNAAKRFAAQASGCTLSRHQYAHAQERIQRERLSGQASIHEMDYRDLSGEFDRIASVGMFEHVGRPQLEAYFRKVHALLAPNGLFLNHGITRPAPVQSDAQSMFIARQVFPGGQIVCLGDVVQAAENAGFEVLDVENLRRHYARTCRAWVQRLLVNRDACLKAVDPQTWRTWHLYLAGSAVAFEDGGLGLHQVLLCKRGASGAAPMTRADLYSQGAI